MRDTIEYLVVAVAIAAAVGTVYYSYEQNLPCVEPVHFTLGAIDPHFGIDNASVLQDAEAAAAIWNAAAGKVVLVYDPKGNVPINLVYDSRQATAQLGARIASEQAATDEQETSIDSLKAQYASLQTQYNQEVAAANARGGADRSEYASLEAERAQLQSMADSINTQINSYNTAVRAVNAEVNEYNQSAGTTFEEGQYVQDAQGKRINIFEFTSNTQLERVLAHEMGHSIGLGHNTNPQSIMFARNESGNLVPTVDDLAALDTLCRIK